jgi:mannose-1-phosphate guanylyltransferase
MRYLGPGTMHTPSLWALILAGGDGRGVSTPRQYCSLKGGPSLLHLSLQRALRLVARERIIAVVTEPQRRWWEPQLADLPRSNVIVQPANRGTGIGVLLPLLVLEKTDPTASVICLPSDHYVADEETLAGSLRRATELPISCDKLTLLGMRPSCADTGLGYLSPVCGRDDEVRALMGFFEKPDREQAARLIQAGSAWSSGIMAGLLKAVLYLYSRHVPRLLRNLRPIVRAWSNTAAPSISLIDFYARHAAVDFSRDVLQKQPARLQMLMVPDCGWNDVGTPTRLVTTLRTPQPLGDDSTSSAPSISINHRSEETIRLMASINGRAARS